MDGIIKAVLIAFSFIVNRESENEANNSVMRFAQNAMRQLRNIGEVAAAIAFDKIVQNLLKATSQAEDTQFVFENIYGDMATAQAAWAEEFANTYNRSATKVKESLAQIQHEMVGFTKAGTDLEKKNVAEMSKTIEQAALNLGAFYGLDTKTAINTLLQATEGSEGAMQTFNVGQGRTLNQNRQRAMRELYDEGALSDYAIQSYQNLTPYEKSLVNLRTVLNANTQATDALARSQLNYSTMQENLSESLQELKEILGAFFLPTAKVIVDYLIKIVRYIGDQVENIKKLTDALGITEPLITAITAAFAALIVIRVATWLAGILNGLKLLSGNPAFLTIAAAIGLVVMAIRLFTSESTGLKKVFEVFLGVLSLATAALLVYSVATGNAVGTTLGLALSLVKTAAATVAHGIASAAAAVKVWVLNSAMLAFPGTWIVAAIAAVIAILVLMAKNWDKIKEAVTKAFAVVKEKVSGFFNGLHDLIDKVPILAMLLSAIFTGPIGPIVILIRHFDKIKEKVVGAFNAVKGAVKTAFDWIHEQISKAPVISAILSALFTGPIGPIIILIRHFDEIKEKFVNVFNSIKGGAQRIIDAFNTAKSSVQNVFDSIRGRIVGAINAIRSAVKGAFDWIKAQLAKVPDWALVLSSLFLGPIGPILLLIKHFDKLKEAAKKAWEFIKRLFGGDKKNRRSGVDMAEEMAEGIQEGTPKVQMKARGVAQAIDDNIGFSIPEEGPLHHFDESMPDMISLMSRGMEAGKPKLENAAQGLAQSMLSALAMMQNPIYGLMTMMNGMPSLAGIGPGTLALAGGTYGTRNMTNNITFNQEFKGNEPIDQKIARAAEESADSVIDRVTSSLSKLFT